jgi:hypothetical protein
VIAFRFRTAYKAVVEPNGGASGLSWNVWVDGFDGAVLAIQADFICN